MALNSTERSTIRRARLKKEGFKELKNVWIPINAAIEKNLRLKIKEWLK